MSQTFDGQDAQLNPIEFASWDIDDRAALIALREFRATPEQQKLFLAWFLRATGEDNLEFRVDARLSAFASGKRWVSRQFFNIVHAQLKKVDS